MKEYELIVETTQPSCGGKLPKAVDYREIETDDPVAYVRQQENGLEPSVTTSPNGDLVLEISAGARQVCYRFTEV
ncbi:MAG: hypothetical protein VB055_00175 [Oscillospiraceae bacterium]|nr:hypothetical protein [Oscillospiraceae bacterium]